MNSPTRWLAGLCTVLLCGCSTMNEKSKNSFPDISALPAQPGLPNPLVMQNGRPVTTAEQWREQRRPELKALFAHYMYGEIPPKPAKLDFGSSVADKKFLGGKATLKLVTISIPG